MFKRFITTLFCLFLISVSIPFWGYTQFLCFPVYADDTLDGWRNATTNEEFAEAFRYYCKSRDLTIDGTVANVLTNGTTNIFNALCDGIGINMTALQGHIKYEVDSSGNKGLKWLFDSQGITFYNRLFAQFLQDNDLEVGDSVQDTVIDSGYYFQDDEGFGCTAYVISWSSEDTVSFSKTGSPYLYDQDTFISSTPISNTRHYKNFAYTVKSSYSGSESRYYYYLQYNNSQNYAYMYGGTAFPRPLMFGGNPAVAYNTNNNKFVLGCYVYATDNSFSFFKPLLTINVANQQSTAFNIFITTNNNTINNNTYEGDTIINNEGDVINEPNPGGNDPGWNVGGGQGSYNDGQGNNYTINFPDFELPDLNIDWSIQGLGSKFPFSIPFDIAALVTVLNAEPEAPRFQGTLDLGITTYQYDINLAQFDTVASACRIAELLLLVFGLIMITRSIIKG